MSALTTIIRRTGLKPFALGVIDSLGFSLIPNNQDPAKNWLGLRNLPIDIVLDIGACMGKYAKIIALPNFPNAIIHSFEPSPVAYKELKRIADQSQGRIIAHNVGLGDKSEKMAFNNVVDFIYSSSLLPLTETLIENFPQLERVEKIFVDVVPLDQIAATLSPPITGGLLIKMDVQGFEDRVIAGGKSTISKAIACVIEISIQTLYETSPKFDDIYCAMRALNFEFVGLLEQHCDKSGAVLYLDAVFRKQSEGMPTVITHESVTCHG